MLVAHQNEGAAAFSRCFVEHTIGVRVCGQMIVEQSSPDHYMCLFFVFITIYVHHQHKCENSGKTKQMLFDKSK